MRGIIFFVLMLSAPVYASVMLTVQPVVDGSAHHSTALSCALPHDSVHNNRDTIYTLRLDFTNNEQDYVYADYITVSVDSPYVTVSDKQISKEPIMRYDTVFKQVKKIYAEPFLLTLMAHVMPEIEKEASPVYVHVMYYQKSDNGMRHVLLPFNITDSADHAHGAGMPTASSQQLEVYDTSVKPVREARSSGAPVCAAAKSAFFCPPYVQFLYILLIMFTCIATPVVYTRCIKKTSYTRLAYIWNYIKVLSGVLMIVCIALLYMLIAVF